MAGPALTVALLPSGLLPPNTLFNKDPADRLGFLLDAGAFLDATGLALAGVIALQDTMISVVRYGVASVRGVPSRGVAMLLDRGVSGATSFVGLLLQLAEPVASTAGEGGDPPVTAAALWQQQLVVSLPFRVSARLPVGLSPVPLGPSDLDAGPVTVSVPMRAGADVSGQRALMFDDAGGVILADPTVPTYAFAGISLGAALAGTDVPVCDGGWIQDPSWTWTPGAALYVAPGGVLTVVPPVTGILHQVATALRSDAINVQLYPPVTLQ